jgi:aspartyl-tRNA(Asn)/glutamyl-tRNA(Gln) amidotransferase subunit A
VTHSHLTGVTRNPWHTGRTPGGSSGGAVVAAALGLGHFHMGTDGAGSIRIPASFSGAFGIMPGVGRVPAFPASPFGVLARLGPLTRCVEDAALMLQIIAAPDARDAAHAGAAVPDYPASLNTGIRGLRIGWSATLGFVDKLQPAVRAACEAAARRLTEFGAIVEEADPGFTREQAEKPLRAMWDAGCAAIVNNVPEAMRAQMDPGLLRVAARGRELAATDLLEAMAARAALYETMRRYHERYDLLLTPTMPITALEAGRELPASGDFGPEWFDWSPYTWPFNVTGQPGASVPAGLDAAGLPIGLQIIGRMRDEPTVLRAARAVEILQGFAQLNAPVVRH